MSALAFQKKQSVVVAEFIRSRAAGSGPVLIPTFSLHNLLLLQEGLKLCHTGS